MNPLAYAVYLLWIIAGVADFLLHRRSDIPHTIGLKENRLHLVQLLLAAAAIGGWLFLQHTWLVWSALAVATVAHAVIGYADTRSAYRIRAIVPLEQHVHMRARRRTVDSARMGGDENRAASCGSVHPPAGLGYCRSAAASRDRADGVGIA